MSEIFYFNPETDLALGHDREYYTPNKRIKEMKEHLCLLPSLYAHNGDMIAVDKGIFQYVDRLPLFDLVEARDQIIIPLEESGILYKRKHTVRFNPWGWNRSLIRELRNFGIPDEALLNENKLNELRTLAHRKLTSLFFEKYRDAFPQLIPPIYLKSKEEIDKFLLNNPEVCLKAPWSSSGRGVVFSSNMSSGQLKEWAVGILSSQGGVMGEPLYPRILDCASEWIVNNGKTQYCGISLFESSGRGKYKGNHLFSQKKISEILRQATKWDESILEIQKEFIVNHIAPHYSGPLGIDMLATQNVFNPCVEINLRMTMGHVAIKVEQLLRENKDSLIGNVLLKYFPKNIFDPVYL